MKTATRLTLALALIGLPGVALAAAPGTTGQYTQVSMILNSFGVQLDAGQTLDPELKGF